MSTELLLSFLNQKRCVTLPAAIDMDPKSKYPSRACSPPAAGLAATGTARAGSAATVTGLAEVAVPAPGLAMKTATARATAIAAAPSARFLFRVLFGVMVALCAMEDSFQDK